MTNLSISQAWNESAALLKREGRLLFPVAFILIALPGALFQLAMPEPVAGEPPEGGAWLLLFPVAIIGSLIGSIALSFLALRPGASVGEAIQVGLRRFLPLLGAAILLGLLVVVAMMLVMIILGVNLTAGAAPPPTGGAAGGLVLASFILFVIFISLWIRLMVMTSVAAVESPGVIGILKRSWNLTRGHFWRLLGFILLVFVAAVIVMLAVSAVTGLLIVLIAGPVEPGSLAMVLTLIVSALLQSLFSILIATVTARIYAQLSATRPTVTTP